jgi:hypothetical protein
MISYVQFCLVHMPVSELQHPLLASTTLDTGLRICC